MILKSFELEKSNLNNHNFYLFYGNNEGLKEEIIKNVFKEDNLDKIETRVFASKQIKPHLKIQVRLYLLQIDWLFA